MSSLNGQPVAKLELSFTEILGSTSTDPRIQLIKCHLAQALLLLVANKVKLLQQIIQWIDGRPAGLKSSEGKIQTFAL